MHNSFKLPVAQGLHLNNLLNSCLESYETSGWMNTWYDVAKGARRVAQNVIKDEEHRSCINRAYYAVYSKITWELANIGVAFPHGDEGPGHPGRRGNGGIYRLVYKSFPKISMEQRRRLANLIGELYILRCSADYRPSDNVEAREARKAISIMNEVFDKF